MNATPNAADGVYHLSLASNIIAGQRGTQSDLQSALEIQLARYLSLTSPNWQIVWGPVVWKQEPFDDQTGADHVWFVVRNFAFVFPDGKSYDTYVLAVANGNGSTETENGGTIGLEHGGSLDDTTMVDMVEWCREAKESGGGLADPIHHIVAHSLLMEDLDSMLQLPKNLRYIPYSTARTVHRLITTPPPSSTPPFPPVSLLTFISEAKCSLRPPQKIIISGHCLNDTFTYALAFSLLYENDITIPQLDNDHNSANTNTTCSPQRTRAWSRLESLSSKQPRSMIHSLNSRDPDSPTNQWRRIMAKLRPARKDNNASELLQNSKARHRNIVNTPTAFQSNRRLTDKTYDHNDYPILTWGSSPGEVCQTFSAAGQAASSDNDDVFLLATVGDHGGSLTWDHLTGNGNANATDGIQDINVSQETSRKPEFGCRFYSVKS